MCWWIHTHLGTLALNECEAQVFVRTMKDDIVAKWTAFYVEHKRIKPERITRRFK